MPQTCIYDPEDTVNKRLRLLAVREIWLFPAYFAYEVGLNVNHAFWVLKITGLPPELK